MEKTKRKKEGGGVGRKAPQYHSRQLALKPTRQTVGMCAPNCAPVQAPQHNYSWNTTLLFYF